MGLMKRIRGMIANGDPFPMDLRVALYSNPANRHLVKVSTAHREAALIADYQEEAAKTDREPGMLF